MYEPHSVVLRRPYIGAAAQKAISSDGIPSKSVGFCGIPHPGGAWPPLRRSSEEVFQPSQRPLRLMQFSGDPFGRPKPIRYLGQPDRRHDMQAEAILAIGFSRTI
jgi:hypothetical protein